jgi:hypothetical protein
VEAEAGGEKKEERSLGAGISTAFQGREKEREEEGLKETRKTRIIINKNH